MELSSSSSSSKVEAIEQAITKLMEEVNIVKGCDAQKSSLSDDDGFITVDKDNDDKEEQQPPSPAPPPPPLPIVISEVLKAEGKLELVESDSDGEELLLPSTAACKSVSAIDELTKSNSGVVGGEEIVKELKKVKRQNLITHCLLSIMIVLTVAWQISEVSLILKLKDGVTHPFRSIGSAFSGFLKGPKPNGDEQEKDKASLTAAKLIESTPLHDIKIPEFPGVELPGFDLNFDDDE